MEKTPSFYHELEKLVRIVLNRKVLAKNQHHYLKIVNMLKLKELVLIYHSDAYQIKQMLITTSCIGTQTVWLLVLILWFAKFVCKKTIH